MCNKFWIILLISVLTFSCNSNKIIYIDCNFSVAENKSDGSMEFPYTDIESALSFVRNERIKGDSSIITLLFRKGYYRFNKGYELDKNFSNLVLSAYNGEEVVFSGGISIPVSSVKDDKIGNVGLKSVDLSSYDINYGEIKNIGFARPSVNSFGELFLNDIPMLLSRWPNSGMIKMGKIVDAGSVPRDGDHSNRGAVFEYDSLRISKWKFRDNMWISGYFKWGYADDALRIKNINTTKGTISTDGATLYGFYSGYKWNKWYAFNILEEIDMPGEYYIDSDEDKLYFISPDCMINSIDISVLEEPFFDIYDASGININGIIFEKSRAVNISMCNTEKVKITNCIFRNSGSWAIQVGLGIKPFAEYRHEGIGEPVRGIIGSLQQHIYADTAFDRNGGHDNIIENCEFYNLGSGAISLAGGNRKDLLPGNNVVKNCKFFDNNRLEHSYKPAVHITDCGNKIIGCEIYNAPSMAILLHGNNHLIEGNYIHDVCLEVEDQGAFYYGRDPSECGSILRHNVFSNIPDVYNTCAVYHDDGACGLTVEENLFYNAGKFTVLLGGGSDNIYNRNIFVGGQIGVHIDNRLQTWSNTLMTDGGLFEQRLKVVDYLNPPYAVQYPYMNDYMPNDGLPKRNRFNGNVFINIGKLCDNPQFLPVDSTNMVKTVQALDEVACSELFEKLNDLVGIPFDINQCYH